jgi:hypothetical protein
MTSTVDNKSRTTLVEQFLLKEKKTSQVISLKKVLYALTYVTSFLDNNKT